MNMKKIIGIIIFVLLLNVFAIGVLADDSVKDYSVSELIEELGISESSLVNLITYAKETDYEYKVLEDGNVEIISYIGEDKYVEIPSEIAGMKVVSIGDSAFANNVRIRTVTIPASVAKLGKEAFCDCINLEQVDVLGDITEVGSSVFSACRDLHEINFCGALCSISSSMFSGCTGIENLYVPETITYIGGYAFSSCNSLLSIDIPEGVEILDTHTFDGCGKLKSVMLPGTLKYIEEYAFSNCKNVTEIYIPKGVEFIETRALSLCDSLEKIYVHEDIPAFMKGNLLAQYSDLPESILCYYSDEDSEKMMTADYSVLDLELEKYLSESGYSENEYTIIKRIEEVNGIWVELKFDEEKEYLIRIKQTLEGEPYLLYSNIVEKAEDNSDTEYGIGDVNKDGLVDAKDALMILKYVAKLEKLTNEQIIVSELNGDNIIDAGDALEVLKIAAKL